VYRFSIDKYFAAIDSIIVADSNSSCGWTPFGMQRRLQGYPYQRARRWSGSKCGVAASRKHLAFLDSNCLPNLDWIDKGVAAIQAYDFIGGRVIVTSEDPLARSDRSIRNGFRV
jgi:hypothetical protein